MAASDHLQPQQLRMFMTGNEIKNFVNPNDGSRHDPNRMWGQKELENRTPEYHTDDQGRTLGQQIHEEGVKKPVHRVANTNTLMNGHHRVAAAGDSLVPILHHETNGDFMGGKWLESYPRR